MPLGLITINPFSREIPLAFPKVYSTNPLRVSSRFASSTSSRRRCSIVLIMIYSAGVYGMSAYPAAKTGHRTGFVNLDLATQAASHPLSGHLPPVSDCTERDERIRFLQRIRNLHSYFADSPCLASVLLRAGSLEQRGVFRAEIIRAAEYKPRGARILLLSGQVAPA